MLRHLIYPLLPYRSFFFPFLVLSAVTVPCWLIFRLYRIRTSGHRVPLIRELQYLTVVVYLSGLATATLIPSHTSRLVAAAAKAIEQLGIDPEKVDPLSP